MKILLIADNEEKELWDFWSDKTAEKLADVDLILSAGDLKPVYLEFLVTMLNIPLLYVRGNHDEYYHKNPPEGCICLEDKIVVIREDLNEKPRVTGITFLKDDMNARITGLSKLFVSGKARRIGNRGSSEKGAVPESGSESGAENESRVFLITGLGGSMRYRKGTDMFTEEEMSARVRKIKKKKARIEKLLKLADAREEKVIVLTHAPCKGHGDMNDLAHTGFECFNELVEEWRPDALCYGHVHKEYGNFRRLIKHPAGTQLLNGSGYCIFEI